MEVPSNFYTYTPLHKGGRTVSDFTEYPICYLDEKKITGIKAFWKMFSVPVWQCIIQWKKSFN